jgi:hypothetical protein
VFGAMTFVLRSPGWLGKALEWKILQLAETLHELISRPSNMTANSPAFGEPCMHCSRSQTFSANWQDEMAKFSAIKFYYTILLM